MKLFAFTPKGHGQQSFFVMANSEEEARHAVQNKINELLAGRGDDGCSYSDYDFEGFGTDYYRLDVYELNHVALNSND